MKVRYTTSKYQAAPRLRTADLVSSPTDDTVVLPSSFEPEPSDIEPEPHERDASSIGPQRSSGPGRAAKPKPVRLLSLDAFRGLTVFGMLLVNNIALDNATPKTLLHAEWSGKVTIADLVFPWFLFIVGVALPYSVASARKKHLPSWQFDMKALWRAVSLMFLGCLNDSLINRQVTFDLNVLQLIGLSYFTAVLFGGLFRLRGRIIFAALLLVANWAILKLANIPGHGPGHFTENLNVIDYVNNTYLSQYHLNGALSVIPTTALILIGTIVGDLLRRKKIESLEKVGVLSVCGAGMVAVGWLWSQYGTGVMALPMNKPCWTATYILYCGGWASIGLALMYLIVDVTPGKWGAKLTLPLLVFGSNAIVAYCAPIITKVGILQNVQTTWPEGHRSNLESALTHWFKMHWGSINGGWAYTLTYIAFWWCILLVLYRKRWFLKV